MANEVRSAKEAVSNTIVEEWGSLTWLANSDLFGTTGLTLGEVVIKRGKSNPRHKHNSCEEVLYLLSGKLRHSIGDGHVDIEAGDTIVVHAGVYHNAVSVGEEDAVMIVAYSCGTRDIEFE